MSEIFQAARFPLEMGNASFLLRKNSLHRDAA